MTMQTSFARNLLRIIPIVVLLALTPALHAADKLKALIVDGQNNHKVWPKSTVMMKQYLEATGLFEVAVARTKYIWSAEREAAFLPLAGAGESQQVKNPQPDPNFKPDFAKYAVVISNFGWKAADWPEETQKAFEKYVAGGGGFVSVHAADNSWGNWTEWAATGKVTQKIPADFPSADKISARPFQPAKAKEPEPRNANRG